MASASLYLPLVSWHQYTNVNTTTTTLLYHHAHVYAGQKDGHIWVYTLDKQTSSLRHKYLLTGHKAAITALYIFNSTDTPYATNNNGNQDILVSADETGEIARWDTTDGRCQVVNPHGFFGCPTQLKVFDTLSNHYIFCCGQSNEICILNTTTLEVVRVWGGHTNWVTCTSFYDPYEKRIRLMTATMTGQLDIWDMDIKNVALYKEKKFIKNQPSSSSNQDNATTMLKDALLDSVINLISHPFTGLFLMITRKSAIVFTLNGENDFIPHFTLPASLSEEQVEWVGGEWVGHDRLVLWTLDGTVFDYRLHSPQGVPNGTVVSKDSQLYYSATLSTTYSFPNENHSTVSRFDGCVSTLCQSQDDNENNTPMILTFFNRSNGVSSFSMESLVSDPQNNNISRSKEISFMDIWPMQSPTVQQPHNSITSTIPVSSNHLAIGYENGTICVVPLTMALLHLNQLSDHFYNRQDTRIFEKAHHGKVTCLLVPEHHSSEQKYLLSGGRDGCVKIWNLINGKFVASFTVHASPVQSFVEPAEQKDSRVRGCVVSIAHDHSLALISVDSMTCLYIIPGYTYPLTQIQWRPSEDYVLFGYTDGVVFVWQLQAGHLDRVLHGTTSKQVMADDRWPCNRIVQSASSSRKSNPNTNHTVHTRSILSQSQDLYTDTLFAQVFIFNIRRLVYDLLDSSQSTLPPNAYTGHSLDGSSSSTATRPQPMISLSTSAFPSLSTSTSSTFGPDLTDPLDTKHDDDMDTITASNNNIFSSSQQTTQRDHSDDLLSNSDGKKRTFNNKDQQRIKKRELVSAVMSVLVSPSMNNNDEFHPSAHGISYGIRGANGYLSLVAPSQNDRQPWTLSSTLTASRLLSIALLSQVEENPMICDNMMDYGKDLRHKVGENYCPPSLPFLSKYWQDPKARTIFSMAIMALDATELHSLIHYWKKYLPASSSSSSDEEMETQMMTRATILLGIIGCDQPQMLDDTVRKSTALSLTLLLSDNNVEDLMMEQEEQVHQEASSATTTITTTTAPETSTLTTESSGMSSIDPTTLTRILSSMELLSQGFSIWETYINASNVLRTLITYANSRSPSLRTTITQQQQQAMIRQGAKNAIFTIAQNNHMPLVIGTLTYDTIHAKNINHRLACLRMISSFIRKNPMLLYGHVYRVMEAVVKTLNPNIPHMRESVLATATSTLHDLVRIYPSVDFSSHAQKLVVGTLEGAAIVYDLQTATRSVVLEGHTGPVNVVKFSPDAKWIATGSLTDQTVRVWYAQLSLFGMFTSGLSHIRDPKSSPSSSSAGAQKPYKVFSFALPESNDNNLTNASEQLQFQWPSNRCVKLLAKDLVMSFNV
ncbi:uncharacterized protein BX664DRAFT_286560 [Halteromyces radiatus]|uniref:uncharacterized protein n=1 Tax=Halteromyces radiatus TaxID=101107 RepID=UPI0022200501|nr:uncharacterized protein BX664DRAFT_286560 [Halteromyces radiatus]KAI8080052.1 hypothetical protein BX664DRAFT_286560 [Halteromyces radiatus]